MTSNRATVSLSKNEHEKIKSLIEEGRFTSKSDVLRTALRIMLEENPEYKREIAVNFYKEGKVTLRRASEIAGTSPEEFKEILKRRGIRIEIEDKEDEEEKVEKLKAGKPIVQPSE